jgi:hypothetical protein
LRSRAQRAPSEQRRALPPCGSPAACRLTIRRSTHREVYRLRR